MDIVNDELLSVGEALEEAEKVKSLVGEHASVDEYRLADELVTREKIRQELEKKGWGVTVLEVAENVEDSLSHQEKKFWAEAALRQSDEWYRAEDERVAKAEKMQAAIMKAKDTLEKSSSLPIELYSDEFYFALDEVTTGIDFTTVQSIMEKLFQLSEARRLGGAEEDTIELTEEEKDLLVARIPDIIEFNTKKLERLRPERDKYKAEVDEQNEKIGYYGDRSREDDIAIEEGMKHLLKVEEELGAPPFAPMGSSEEEIFRSYQERIEWRENRFDTIRLRYSPKEVGYKWALVVKIGEAYHLLNRERAYHPLTALDLVRYLVPQETFAVASEVLVHRDTVRVLATLNHGVMTTEAQPGIAAEIKEQKGPIIEQLRY